MNRLRRLILANRALSGALLALVLVMKFVVPAGFMPAMADGKIVISICTGTGPATAVVAIPGARQGDTDGGGHYGKDDHPCAFAGLSAPALSAGDPILLVLAIFFVLALGLRPAIPVAARPPFRLRPPLRAPPAF